MAAGAGGDDRHWEMEKPAVVIDNGTGYTKMGYAGNATPQYIIPTAIASREGGAGSRTGAGQHGAMSDLDFHIGDDAVANSSAYQVNYPIRHGLIENWDNMERLWQRCMFDYLRCEPEEHHVMLTEPPLNPPENREYAAEVMFETYNVPGLYIAVQAVLALAASWPSRKEEDRTLTGTVVDSGDGVTHVIPVAEGYVLGSCIRHIPLAGHDITRFVLQQLRDRGEALPPEVAMDTARRIKEDHCYVSQDMVREFRRYDDNPSKHFRKYTGKHPRTGAPWEVDVGYEQFLGPELFFNPEIYSSEFTKPLPQIVDESVLASPLDVRRSLYKNIVMSGGSTLFKNFHKRLQQDLRNRVNTRLEENRRRVRHTAGVPAPSVDVKVIHHQLQRYAVWFGGSMLASDSNFYSLCHTKAQYEEEGPRIARHNPVFMANM